MNKKDIYRSYGIWIVLILFYIGFYLVSNYAWIDKIYIQPNAHLSTPHIQASSLPSVDSYGGKSDPVPASVDSITLPAHSTQKNANRSSRQVHYRKTQNARIIHINTATMDDWESLYNIGPYRAERIMKFRQVLGGFYSVDQVGETYGLPDSVFQKIRPNLKVGNNFKRIHINEVVYDSLYQHPYITKQMAYFIVKHRESKKPIQNMNDLYQIIQEKDHERLKKLEPYLYFDIK